MEDDKTREGRGGGDVATQMLEALQGLRGDLRSGLAELRAEVQGTNGQLDQTNGRLEQISGRVDQISGRVDQISGQLDQTNGRLEQISGRVDQTNARLDLSIVRLDRLERRQVDAEVRLTTELVAVVKAVGEVRDLLATRLDVHDQVIEHEHRLVAVERKLGLGG